MIKLLCVLMGIYLIVDSMYLASHADHENRQCVIAKYVGAFMCGAYLVYLNVVDLAIEYGIYENDAHLFISNEATQIELLFALTIAFFMWPDTFFRVLDWLRRNHPKLYFTFCVNFSVKSRRSEN